MTSMRHLADPAPGLTLPAPGLTRGLPATRRQYQPEAPGQARGGYPDRKGTAQ